MEGGREGEMGGRGRELIYTILPHDWVLFN